MASGADPLPQAMRRLSKSLRDSLETTGIIDDALTKGELREAEVVEALQPHFPRRWDLRSRGVVVNPSGQQSDPQDIVVTDAFIASPFVAEGGLGLFPIECVAATIQVKTYAEPATVKSGVKNLASMKDLAPKGIRHFAALNVAIPGHLSFGYTDQPPFAAAIFFQPRAEREAVFEAFRDACRGQPPDLRPNMFCVLDEYLIQWATNWTEGEGPLEGSLDQPITRALTASGADWALLIDWKEHALLNLYVALLEALRLYSHPPLNLHDYVGTLWTGDDYLIGPAG